MRGELRNTPGEFTDFDMTTNATPAQSEQILSAWGEHIWDIGKEYGTISARKNGAVYEVRPTAPKCTSLIPANPRWNSAPT